MPPLRVTDVKLPLHARKAVVRLWVLNLPRFVGSLRTVPIRV